MDADIVEVDEETASKARGITPVQFFDGEDSVADRDFRPKASKIDVADRADNEPTEDGHGHAWRPPATQKSELALDPSTAHDPHVSPIPEREYEGEFEETPVFPVHPSEISKAQESPFTQE